MYNISQNSLQYFSVEIEYLNSGYWKVDINTKFIVMSQKIYKIIIIYKK